MQKHSKIIKTGLLGARPIPASINRRKIFEWTGYFGTHADDETGTEEFEEFITQAEAIVVADLAWSDFQTISDLIRSTRHVYLEHPYLLSNGEIRRLENLALEAGVVVQLGLKHRYAEGFRVIKEFDIRPRIIDCNRQIKFSDKTTHISVISDLMLQDIDVALNLAGSPVKSINATGVGVMFDDPDVVNARIEFYNGCIATLNASKISGKEVHKSRFYQNNSYYSLNFLDQSVSMLRNGSDNEEWIYKPEESDTSQNSDIFARELETFYRCIMDKSLPVANVGEYLNTRLVADQIIDQLERNFRKR